MKTFFKDYSLASRVFGLRGKEIGELVNMRQSQLNDTSKYQEAEREFEAVVSRLRGMLDEEGQEVLRLDLDSAVVSFEVICFDAGYKAGMADLMTAMTLNEAGLTKVEYFNLTGNHPGDSYEKPSP